MAGSCARNCSCICSRDTFNPVHAQRTHGDPSSIVEIQFHFNLYIYTYILYLEICLHGKERSSIDKKEKMWKVVSNTRRGDNIRDININYTSYIFIERLLQKRILFFFFFFIYAFSSSRNKRKKFHTNCKFIRFLITFFRSIRIERWE